MFKISACGLLVSAMLLAACSYTAGGGPGQSAFQHISVAGNGDVIAYAHDGSGARISAAGDLDIGGKAASVTPQQRPLLTTYHTDALALRNDAIATGKAGAGLGLNALGTVAKGLASGNPDSIDKKLQPEADKVEALGNKVCADLAALYTAQGKLVVAIPQFKPYATIEPHQVSECHANRDSS